MEGYDPWYLAVAVVSSILGCYAVMRGRTNEDQKSTGIGIVLFVLTFFVQSAGPLGFFTLVLGVGLFSDELLTAWAVAGKKAAMATPPKSKNRGGGLQRRR